MKLSEATYNILKNFASINQSLIIDPGNEIRVLNKSQSVFGLAKVAEQFPREFAIYDLANFLSVLSLYKEPEIEFEDTYLTIKSDNCTIKYMYADPRVSKNFTSASKFDVGDLTTVLTVKLSKDILKSIGKAYRLMDIEHVGIYREGDDIFFGSYNKNYSSGSIKYKLGSVESDFKYSKVNIVFPVSLINFVDDDYEVCVSDIMATKFVGGMVVYTVAPDSDVSVLS